jgi:hypothetical protein
MAAKTCQRFGRLPENQSLTFTDLGLRDATADLDNLVLCQKRLYNNRMIVGAAFMMVSFIGTLAKLVRSAVAAIEGYLTYVVAAFNTLLAPVHQHHPDEDPAKRPIAEGSSWPTGVTGQPVNRVD